MGTDVKQFQESDTISKFRESVELHKRMKEIVRSEFREGVHFGLIPGCQKKSLWLAGGERVISHYGITVEYRYETSIEGDVTHFYCYATATHGETLIQKEYVAVASTDEPTFYKVRKDGSVYKATRHHMMSIARKRAFVGLARSIGCMSDEFTDEDVPTDMQEKTQHRKPPTRTEPPQGIDIQGMKNQIWEYCLAESDGDDTKAQAKLFDISTGWKTVNGKREKRFEGITDVNDPDFSENRVQFVHSQIFRKQQ